MVADPDDALDCAVMRQSAGAVDKEVRLGVRSVEIEHPDLLLLPASEQIRRAWGEGDASDDVIVREGLETLAGVRVPEFARRQDIGSGTGA